MGDSNISNGHTENPIVSKLPGGGYLAIFDDLASEYAGFGAACSEDGLHWPLGGVIPVKGGVRTPFGLVAMTPSELAAYGARINVYGVTTIDQLRSVNSTVHFLFYTQTTGGWETFRMALVEQGAA